jgi:hypothetical protein
MSLSEQPGVPKIGFCWFITPKTVGLGDISEIPWDIPTSTPYFLRVLGDKKRDSRGCQVGECNLAEQPSIFGNLCGLEKVQAKSGDPVRIHARIPMVTDGTMGIHGGFSDKLPSFF